MTLSCDVKTLSLFFSLCLLQNDWDSAGEEWILREQFFYSIEIWNTVPGHRNWAEKLHEV